MRLTSEVEAACRTLQEAMDTSPPPYLLGAPSAHSHRPHASGTRARSDLDNSSAHRVLVRHAEMQLAQAMYDETQAPQKAAQSHSSPYSYPQPRPRYDESRQAASVASESDSRDLSGEGVARCRHAALRRALDASHEALHRAEAAARDVLERDVSQLCSDLEVEIAQIEARLLEVQAGDGPAHSNQPTRAPLPPPPMPRPGPSPPSYRSPCPSPQVQAIDLSDAKKAAIRAAPNLSSIDAVEKDLLAASAPSAPPASSASASSATAPCAATTLLPSWEEAGGAGAASSAATASSTPGELNGVGGGEAAVASAADVRMAEAEAERSRKLDELRALIAIRKLRESASEAVHERRLDALRNKVPTCNCSDSHRRHSCPRLSKPSHRSRLNSHSDSGGRRDR